MKATTKDILKLERIKRGWTQEDVAKMLNMGRASYAQYETGKNTPTTENIIKLAKIYNVTTDYLLYVDIKKVIEISLQQGKDAGNELADELTDKIKRKRVRKKKTQQE